MQEERGKRKPRIRGRAQLAPSPTRAGERQEKRRILTDGSNLKTCDSVGSESLSATQESCSEREVKDSKY